MNDFTGSKVALFHDGKLLVFLRDDKPGIHNPGLWDFFGGGREGDESPLECAIREIEEETGIRLREADFEWKREFESVNESGRTAFFFVARLSREQVEGIVFTEGQRWELMSVAEFLSHENAVEGMKMRLRDYLDATGG